MNETDVCLGQVYCSKTLDYPILTEPYATYQQYYTEISYSKGREVRESSNLPNKEILFPSLHLVVSEPPLSAFQSHLFYFL